jgi:hypothetical protein
LLVECCSVVGAKARLGLAFSLVAKLFIYRHHNISRISPDACYRIVVEVEEDVDSCIKSDVLLKMWKEP